MLKAAPSAQDTCLPSISLYTPSLAWGASRYPWCSRPAMKLKILKYTLHIPHVSLSIFSAAVAIHFRNHHTARSINERSPEVHTSERTLVSLRGRGAASSGRGVNVVLDTEQPRLALLDQPRVHCAVVEVGERCNNPSHKPLSRCKQYSTCNLPGGHLLALVHAGGVYDPLHGDHAGLVPAQAASSPHAVLPPVE